MRRRWSVGKPGLKVAAGLLLLLLLGTIRSVSRLRPLEARAATLTAPTISQQLASLTHYMTVGVTTKPFLDAKEFILVDGANGNVLTELKAHDTVPIGSTTKMVTALLAMSHFSTDQVITLTSHAAAINGSTLGLKAGEKISVGNLLKGLLIPSGNDAAYGLAESVSGVDGNFQPFVDQMNKFITDHHLKNTHFMDPAGLSDDGHSTAFDLAQIGRLLLANQPLSTIVGTANDTMSSADNSATYPLRNTNQLLQPTSNYYNANVVGIKTGFTPAAGYCLVAAETFHGQTLIGVVLGVPGNGETASAAEINKLFRWAETNVTVNSY